MNVLYLTIFLPFLSFLLLAFSQGRWSENMTATVGVGSIGLAGLVNLYIVIDFYSPTTNSALLFQQNLWHWIVVDDFKIGITLLLDRLSLTMLSVIIGVGFLIHIFSAWYMRGKEGYSRFFAYTNLFIASMVLLVLSDNLLVMYVGWEGVGLCSYLLIGFYYKNPSNGAAAMKAFIITRIGDVFLTFALFILYNKLGTLNVFELIRLATKNLAVNDTTTTLVTLALLGGAIGKSAQLPFQTWLADAMAGPTPVSALIHAATMVTAGVYLIARMNFLFLMAPAVLYLVAIIGASTLLLASFAALVQTDIKRVLAYSTMSQIGYMFLALGVQAWDAAIFHMMTHAFFKALLFLSAGSIIQSCHHQQNILKMGGLCKRTPLVYVCFLVGGAALSALPFITAGFFSKEKILAGAMANGHFYLMVIGLVGAFITSLYTFRMIFIVFHGEEKIIPHTNYSVTHHLPLLVLLVLSTFIGALYTPFFQGVLPETAQLAYSNMLYLTSISGIVVILGILLAAALWLGKRKFITKITNNTLGRFFLHCWFHAGGFDWLYSHVFVNPYLGIAKLLKHDPINLLINFFVVFLRWGNVRLTISENGQVRWYIASMGMGAVIVLMILILM
ncbi:NADH-quinone oxidoreductase subunit L [Candidatus Gillettellia adelgis]